MSELLRRELALACSPAHAFRVFSTMTDLWWPRGHRRTSDATMVFEARRDGRLFECSPEGSEWVLGQIVAFDPPTRFCFDWFPGSPTEPTSVEVVFAADGDGTRVSILHRALSPAAIAAWPHKVALFERGWDTILRALRDYVERSKTRPTAQLRS